MKLQGKYYRGVQCIKFCLYNKSIYFTEVSVAAEDSRVTFQLTDGSLIVLGIYSTDSAGEKYNWQDVIVDINGKNNPNRFGRDVFYFVKTSEKSAKGFLPRCYNKSSDEINAECSKNGTGMCCAAKIIGDGWQIRDNYPW